MEKDISVWPQVMSCRTLSVLTATLPEVVAVVVALDRAKWPCATNTNKDTQRHRLLGNSMNLVSPISAKSADS